MSMTFDTVDEKVAEAEFFLQKMSKANTDMFDFRCYFSAFLAATRTITLSLQQFKDDIPGFDKWYQLHQDNLKGNKLARFFIDTRNAHLHGKNHPVTGGSFYKGNASYRFENKNERELIYKEMTGYAGEEYSPKLKPNYFVPNEDVFTACIKYFVMLLEIVYDCYVVLGPHIDPQQHYTKENFASIGKNIEQAECELFGWICTSLIDDGLTEDDRWHHLRGKVGECMINHLFHAYLGKTTPEPVMPDYYSDFEYTPEEKGWVHIPAGFSTIEEYLETIHNNRGNE